MARLLKMYCCGCKQSVKARLTNGEEVYQHLPKLAQIPFWICDTCKNFVGTHHKSTNPTKPLGVIATPEIKKLRILIHSKLDKIWKEKIMTRKKVYKKISDKMNFDYHTANIKHLSEAEKVLEIISTLK
tara:strand:- start:191 stop:577 length:387 start_codon:yes stop_codon:yes gene_type:complete